MRRVAWTMAALMGAMGCGSKSQPGTPDLGTGGDAALTVELSSPPGRVYTHGTVTLQVIVLGGTADSVTLLLDGQPLATLAEPLQYSWDTSSFPEGTHQVLARAVSHGKSFDSAARDIVIDRTGPTVVRRTPAPGSKEVHVEAPIVVQFSEPVAPSTITDGSVMLLAGGTSVSATHALSDDGTTLTLTPSFGRAAPAISAQLSPAITDLAGNPLALPGDAWSWTMPEWLRYGDFLAHDPSETVSHVRMRVDAKGRPVVLFGSGGNVYVSRWSDTGWQALGSTLNAVGQSTPVPSSLALDPAGNPVAVYGTGSGSQIVRWDEAVQSWSPIPDAAAPAIASVAISGDGTIYWVYGTGSGSYEVARWTKADGWTKPGVPIQLINRYSTVWMHVDGSGTPYVIGCEESAPFGDNGKIHLYRFDGDNWVEVAAGFGASSLPSNEEPSLAFDATGAPVVARAQSNGTFSVSVFRYDGTDWRQLGPSLTSQQTLTQDMSVAKVLVDATGRFDLVYYDAQAVIGWRGDGTAWQPLGLNAKTGLVTPPYELQAELDPAGMPIVASLDSTSGVRIAVDRFNR